jgi:hypothetical protein
MLDQVAWILAMRDGYRNRRTRAAKRMSWLVRLVPGMAPDGGHILSVLAKNTYAIAHQQRAVEDLRNPLPWLEADVYWGTGNPATDPVREESDLVAHKPCADFILVGSAWAPRGKKARFFDAVLQVGNARKLVRVFGNRTVQLKTFGFEFSEPELFDTMPLHHGLAYGGTDSVSDPGNTYTYPRNPVGKGFVVKKEPKALHGLQLPNLEDPTQLLVPENLVLGRFQDWSRWPVPASFGPMGRNFQPRLDLAGLPPNDRDKQEWARQKSLASMPEVGAGPESVPHDSTPLLNPLFFNGAPEGQKFPLLRGDETVRLGYMDPDFPLFEFQLPDDVPTPWMNVNDEGAEELQPVLQTVVVHKETNQVTLVWRGSAYYGGPQEMAQYSNLQFGVEED